MKKYLIEVILVTMALLLLGGCSEKNEAEAALLEEKAAFEASIDILEKDELKSREAIGETIDQIELIQAQLEAVHLSFDALKSEEILLVEDTGSVVADINEFPAIVTDGNEFIIQSIGRYMETYTYQYDVRNYPEDANIDALVLMAIKASDYYKFLSGGFATEVGDAVSEAPLPWALFDAEKYDTSDALVNLLLELYTPSDVRVVLDESFASESEAVRLPYYIQEGQIYYNLNRVDGDENFRQPANEPRIKWQRVTESEICLTLVYPVNVKDDDGKPIRTEIFEEVYTFYKTSNGWKLKPNSNEKSYVWSSEDEVWKAQAHVVTPDQVDQWVMSLDKHLADYPEQNEVYETFYQEAHMMSYDNKYFEAEGNDTSGFDVLVFNGDESLMNLEVGEDIGDYRTTESLAGTLIYGVGPETYVVQKKLSDGEVSYEERPYELFFQFYRTKKSWSYCVDWVR